MMMVMVRGLGVSGFGFREQGFGVWGVDAIPVLNPPIQSEKEGGAGCASLGLADHSQVDMLGLRHKPVNFGVEKRESLLNL